MVRAHPSRSASGPCKGVALLLGPIECANCFAASGCDAVWPEPLEIRSYARLKPPALRSIPRKRRAWRAVAGKAIMSVVPAKETAANAAAIHRCSGRYGHGTAVELALARIGWAVKPEMCSPRI